MRGLPRITFSKSDTCPHRYRLDLPANIGTIAGIAQQSLDDTSEPPDPETRHQINSSVYIRHGAHRGTPKLLVST